MRGLLKVLFVVLAAIGSLCIVDSAEAHGRQRVRVVQRSGLLRQNVFVQPVAVQPVVVRQRLVTPFVQRVVVDPVVVQRQAFVVQQPVVYRQQLVQRVVQPVVVTQPLVSSAYVAPSYGPNLQIQAFSSGVSNGGCAAFFSY